MRALQHLPRFDWHMKAELAEMEAFPGNTPLAFRLVCQALGNRQEDLRASFARPPGGVSVTVFQWRRKRMGTSTHMATGTPIFRPGSKDHFLMLSRAD